MSPLRRGIFRFLLVASIVVTASRVLGAERFVVGSTEVQIRITPAIPGGLVVLELGPFGELSWRMHAGPLNVEAGFLVGPDARDLPDFGELGDLRWRFLLRKLPWLLIAGALTGALVAGVADRKRLLIGAGTGAGGLVALSGLFVGISILTFNAAALDSPRYRGPIRDLPRVLQIVKEVRRDFAGVKRNLNKLMEGLERIHAQMAIQGTNVDGATGVRLLVVSDLHNNPLGMLITQQLVDRFDVDGVLNAGDFSDRGTEIEGELFARFSALGVPQVVAPGNHEDREAVARIRRVPGVQVLGERVDTAEIRGITILGAADPNSFSIDSNPFNDVADARVPEICERIARRRIETGARIVLVHDRRLAECAIEQAREAGALLLVVHGHDHKQALEQDGSVTIVDPGTSGANGVKTGRDAPYGFSLIEVDPATGVPTSVCQMLFEDPSRLQRTACSFLTPVPGTIAEEGDGAVEEASRRAPAHAVPGPQRRE